ncbi:pentatricopeptide repeat-containing protein DOT4, chloroplastic [Typha latifolia]|uniref:pentatricopeptide repeat-containing protein DOT4, chloroplastic n=1 Tax=Typha latifolia TaxID=4733 RepID=UPI003C2EB0CF
MIRGYSCNGSYQEAIDLFHRKRKEGIRPDSYTFSCVLKACASLSDIRQGRELHELARGSGFHSDVFVCNSLIHMYAKCGSLEDTIEIFDKMPQRDIVSWNSVISAFATNGLDFEAYEEVRTMFESGLKPDQVTIIGIIMLCSVAMVVREVHGYVLRMGFDQDSMVLNSLISAYGKCGRVVEACRTFNGSTGKDRVTWNAIISAYAQNGLFEESIQLLRDMKLSCLDVDVVTYSGIISSLSQNGLSSEALAVFKELVSTGLKPDVIAIASILPAISSFPCFGYCKEIHAYCCRHNLEPDRRIRNALVSVYSKYGAIQSAEQVFGVIGDRDVISWSSMIVGYAQNQYFTEALDTFRQMTRAKIEPNPITITSVLSACAGVSGLKLGREVHLWAIKNKYEDQSFVGSALLDMYAKCGRIEESRRVFDLMEDKNLVTYNAMIGAYAVHGQGENALEVFRMLEDPDQVSFIAALSACSHGGLVEEGIRIFNTMKNSKASPRDSHYSCMVDLLARAGRLNQALDLIVTMPMKPSIEIWGVLLGACKVHKNLEIGIYTGAQIIESASDNSGYYVLISNMLADFGRWEDVEVIRKLMKEKGVKKGIGHSWIELDHGVYSFVSEGRTQHPEWEVLFNVLSILNEHMREPARSSLTQMAAALLLSSLSNLHYSFPSPSNDQWKRKKLNRPRIPFSSKSQLAILHPDPRTTIKKASLAIHEKQHIDLNAEIRRFCQLGDLREAMRIVTHLDSKSPNIDSETYCSVLQLCGKVRSLDDGRKVHCMISSSDVEIDTVLGSKLVFMYVKCGDVREGRRVFDQIAPKGEPFAWNLLLNAYVRAGDFEGSMLLFKEMQGSSTKPDSHTFSCILKCLSILRSVRGGETIHGYLTKLGFEAHNAVGNALISFYSKCKKNDIAINLFDEMPHKDIISWNSIISGFASNGFPNKAVELLITMWHSGVDIDLATVVCALPACTEMGYLSVGRAIHGYSAKSGFTREVTLNNSLIDMYSKCLNLDNAIQIFEKMGQKSVVSWTAMIAAYTRAGRFDEAIALFEEMESDGIKPDLFAVTSVLHACACRGSLDKGKVVHDYVVRNFMEKSLYVANALMDMYAKCGDMEEARSLFDHTVNKDIISWNTMIGGYSRNCLPNEALSLFSEMQFHLRPNSVTMACILPAVASLSTLERGREIHGHILRTGCFADGHVANALVDMYIKCGALLLACVIFDRMITKDLISWTVMIAGYGMHGHGKSAIATFKEMRGKGIEPDEVSFIAILYACSHSGLIDEGWRFFNIMRNEFKIEPKLEHYACMVDLLSRAGRLTKAYKFIESMPIEPDSTVWGALLCGCRIHRDVKLAERVAERVFELEPENTGYYILLANIYAEAEKWEAVKKLRERIGGRGLRKNPGCSWIEIKSKVYIFFTGDKSHPSSKKIEEFLGVVRQKMNYAAYVPKTRYALMNADDTVKEEALCGHSEKLAIAFGILNSPKGKPIRVAKNLRVCGDCHEVAKFISKMVSREIILRDSNRFHHFEEGRCSCRGYW